MSDWGQAGQYRLRSQSSLSTWSKQSADSLDCDETPPTSPTSAGVPRVKKLRRPLQAWSKEDVNKWLRVYHKKYFQLYKDIFERHELTGRGLLRMNPAKLEKMGISDPEHREDLLYHIFRLQIKHQMKLLQKLKLHDCESNC